MIFWQWKTCKHFVVSLVRKHIFYWKKKNCSIGVAKLWLDITVVGLCCWNSDEKWWKNWTRGLFFFFSLLGEGFQYRGGSTHTRSVTRTIHFLTRSKFLHFFGKKQRRTLLWEKWTNFPTLGGLLLSSLLSFLLFRLLHMKATHFLAINTAVCVSEIGFPIVISFSQFGTLCTTALLGNF